MKLLFDQNLSSDLVRRLSDLFPESTHVQDVQMMRSEDRRRIPTVIMAALMRIVSGPRFSQQP
jgi:predicted nuclease of predicted toxin-antitoxin system